jgi:hypothetical protein
METRGEHGGKPAVKRGVGPAGHTAAAGARAPGRPSSDRRPGPAD